MGQSMRAILEELAKPRYPIGMIYMAVTYQLGANIITEALLIGIFWTIYDYIMDRNGQNK